MNVKCENLLEKCNNFLTEILYNVKWDILG